MKFVSILSACLVFASASGFAANADDHHGDDQNHRETLEAIHQLDADVKTLDADVRAHGPIVFFDVPGDFIAKNEYEKNTFHNDMASQWCEKLGGSFVSLNGQSIVGGHNNDSWGFQNPKLACRF